jgi:DNA polymerase-3 subunit delta'
VLAPGENEKALGKNAVTKDLIPWLGLRPYRQEQKIAVVAGAQLMTPEAANALLKLLEEPPSYALLILLADSEALLPTVVSRCQTVRFHALDQAQIEKILTDAGLDAEEARRRAVLSQAGGAGLALALTPEEVDAAGTAAAAIVQGVWRSERAAVFSAAARLEREPLLLKAVLTLMRDARVYQATGDANLLFMPEIAPRLRAEPARERFFDAWQEVMRLDRYRSGPVNKLALAVNLSYALRRMLQG